MSTESSAGLYKRHRFPAKVIVHSVWLYHRFGLSLRDVQELMAERGVTVTYETIGQMGPQVWASIRRRSLGSRWMLVESRAQCRSALPVNNPPPNGTAVTPVVAKSSGAAPAIGRSRPIPTLPFQDFAGTWT